MDRPDVADGDMRSDFTSVPGSLGGLAVGMVPKTEKEGTRFEIPSGEDKTGDVFTYESRDDLEVMKSYWEAFNESGSGMFYTHVYDEGLVLVRIDGSVSKSKADEYGEVMEDTGR